MPIADHNTIAFAIPARLRRIERLPSLDGWKLWLDTRDFVHGTFMLLSDSGEMHRVTVYEEGHEEDIIVRPCDGVIYAEEEME